MERALRRHGGAEDVITLDSMATSAEKSYSLLNEYLDEFEKEHDANDRAEMADNCRKLLDTLVNSLIVTTVLTDDDLALATVFGLIPVEVVEVG